MKNFSNQIYLIILLSLSFFRVSSQTAPVIGSTAASFSLFTSAGALTNTGASVVTGNIGTNVGNYGGFTSSVLLGEAHVADNVSAAAVQQVTDAFSSFDVNVCPGATAPTLGNSQVFNAGIYCIGEAASLTGTLTLDAQLNPNAIFIIKITGALTTAALSNVLLVNGAQVSNVYWQINGALTAGAGSTFRGTVVSNGAIEFLEGARFQGKALTSAGAITLNNNQINGEIPLPVVLTKFNAELSENENVLVTWSTVSETNSDRFEVQHSISGKDWKEIGVVSSRGESVASVNYSFSHANASRGTNYYRLKMVDKDQTFAYSRIKSIDYKPLISLQVYPNPTPNSITFQVENIDFVQRIQLISLLGISVYDQKKEGFTSLVNQIDMKAYPAGAYVARVTDRNGAVSSLRIVKY